MNLKPTKFIKSEFEIYALFIKHFSDKGWLLKQNCQKIDKNGKTIRGDIDILGIKNNELLVGEIKIKFMSNVIKQAIKHFSFADYVFVGYIEDTHVNRYFENLGIYLIPKTYWDYTFKEPNNKSYTYGCIDLDGYIIVKHKIQKNYTLDKDLKNAYIKKYFDND
ncbi:unnamed protein product [marine sediment metagenome]|uniref:Uncharacterized protein n=1 Tax=marine sediment metagenome TaxID=412755 RepID=X1LIC4_9ZZZZ